MGQAAPLGSDLPAGDLTRKLAAEAVRRLGEMGPVYSPAAD